MIFTHRSNTVSTILHAFNCESESNANHCLDRVIAPLASLMFILFILYTLSNRALRQWISMTSRLWSSIKIFKRKEEFEFYWVQGSGRCRRLLMCPALIPREKFSLVSVSVKKNDRCRSSFFSATACKKSVLTATIKILNLYWQFCGAHMLAIKMDFSPQNWNFQE